MSDEKTQHVKLAEAVARRGMEVCIEKQDRYTDGSYARSVSLYPKPIPDLLAALEGWLSRRPNAARFKHIWTTPSHGTVTHDVFWYTTKDGQVWTCIAAAQGMHEQQTRIEAALEAEGRIA